MMGTYERELETAREVVRAACRLTRAVQDELAAARDRVLKEDRSPVTVADLASQAVISRRLATAFPDDPLMAEEDSSPLDRTPDLARRVLELAHRVLPDLRPLELRHALDRADHPGGRGRLWVLDPIDGTKGFLRGEQYAVALALVEDAQVQAAALGCPNLPSVPGDESGGRGCLLVAGRGRGAWQEDLDGNARCTISVQLAIEPASASACESVEGEHSSHDAAARITSKLGLSGPPRRMDSQCKYGLVARGEVTMYLRLPRGASCHELAWDHAAGSLIVEEAGGRVSDLGGHPLVFDQRSLDVSRGIVASNGHIHDLVLQAAQEIRR